MANLTSSDFDIYILDTNFETVAVIDAFTSFIWTDRYWEYGDFEIELPASVEAVRIFKQDYYVWMKDSEHMMIIENVETDSDAESGSSLIVSGRSLESILDRRIVWGETKISGGLQAGIRKLLNNAMISPSVAARKIDILSFKNSTDSGVTKLEAENQYYGDDLYTIVQDLCQDAKIGFKITMPEDGKFVFELYVGTNRSYDQTENPYVIFSPNYENLINSNAYKSKKDYKNVALVALNETDADGNTKHTTVTVTTGKNYTGLNRRELYVEPSGVSRTVDGEAISSSELNSQLRQKGKESLSDHEITETFDGEAELSRSYKYGVDFYMGDIVEVENEYGQESTTRVTEYIWSQDASETKNYPSFTVIEDEE